MSARGETTPLAFRTEIVRSVAQIGHESGQLNGWIFPSLPFHADNLTERVDDLDEIGLRRHDGVDVLVGGRTLVEHAAIETGFDPLHRLGVVVERDPALGFGTRELAPRAMRAGIERLRIALAADDIGPRAHAARDDPHLAET